MVDFNGKKIVVLGLAKSGTSIAKILHYSGADVIVNDAKQADKCNEKDELENLGIKVICGGHPEDLIDANVDLLVKNPGIPYTIHPIKTAEDLNIPIITEVELAYQFSNAPIIGITGSNGKTTTTTLVGEIIKHAGLSPIVAGNIGTVLSEKALTATEDQVLVTELSSFQLKGTKKFRPHIAVLLNIYPAHLDYHQTIEDYITSKANLFKNQTSNDFSVLNADNEECMKIVPNIKSRTYLFSTKGPVDRGTFIENGRIYWKDEKKLVEILSVKDVNSHLENVLASIIATHLFGVDFKTISNVIQNFKGVEHRLEFVHKTKNDITFYNDSKATNPQATITALKSIQEPIILLAGGLDRGIDFEELIDPLSSSVKTMITFGETAEKLSKIAKISGIQLIHTVDNVTNAVKLANSLAKEGDSILLSPACASWDMYSSFEERGRIFKEAVHRLNIE